MPPRTQWNVTVDGRNVPERLDEFHSCFSLCFIEILSWSHARWDSNSGLEQVVIFKIADGAAGSGEKLT